MERATFGAGCFWGVEHAFRHVRGVLETSVGYMGGSTANPTYADVCTNTTGHAEVVEVVYDPERIAYDDLLDIFWRCHDATQLNRQGEDLGRQYRSAIFWHTPYQKDAAEKSKEAADASDRFHDPIVTEIVPASEFYRAEEYHQQYFEKHGAGSCHGACPAPQREA